MRDNERVHVLDIILVALDVLPDVCPEEVKNRQAFAANRAQRGGAVDSIPVVGGRRGTRVAGAIVAAKCSLGLGWVRFRLSRRRAHGENHTRLP